MVNVRIEEEFLRKTFGCDIVAYYITPPEDGGGHATIEYLDKAAFRTLAATLPPTRPALTHTPTHVSVGTRRLFVQSRKDGKWCFAALRAAQGHQQQCVDLVTLPLCAPHPTVLQCAATIRAVWSPKVCLMERRVNMRRLYERRYSLYERAVTYEGTELDSSTGARKRRTDLPPACRPLTSVRPSPHHSACQGHYSSRGGAATVRDSCAARGRGQLPEVPD